MKCQIKSENNKKGTISSNVVVTPQCEPMQFLKAQEIQDSMIKQRMIQSQPNHHSQVQQMQDLLLPNMMLQDSLSTDMLVPQDQANQQFESEMEEDYSDPCRFINFDNVEQYVNYFQEV